MKCKSLVAVVLLLSCGSALAAGGQRIANVKVSAQPSHALEMSCAHTTAPSRAEVERVLRINDGSQTHALGNKLVGAVGEACNAGVAAIEVKRGSAGQSLTWAPARAGSANAVALN
jgi:hypothetical protein